MSDWKPNGIVSLLTDFGLDDPYVGVMKGVLYARFPGVRPVDLSHRVEPQSVVQAAWFLAHGRSYFPAGTVHMAVVDPGVGTNRRILVAEDGGHAFLAPDNGLLGPVLSGGARVYELDLERHALPVRSRTFHGRDVFAPAAAALAAGVPPEETGPPASDWERMEFPAVVSDGEGILCTRVLYADRFGNLVTPLGRALLAPDPTAWRVEVCGAEMPVLGTYAEAQPGELLALIGSNDSLEVSVREGSAARELGAGTGSEVIVRRP